MLQIGGALHRAFLSARILSWALVIASCATQTVRETRITAKAMPPLTENKAVEAARMELAKGLNVGTGQISVVSVERIIWPDACLGLPTPGETCGMVSTPGFRIILTVREKHFAYHTDLTGETLREESAGTQGE